LETIDLSIVWAESFAVRRRQLAKINADEKKR